MSTITQPSEPLSREVENADAGGSNPTSGEDRSSHGTGGAEATAVIIDGGSASVASNKRALDEATSLSAVDKEGDGLASALKKARSEREQVAVDGVGGGQVATAGVATGAASTTVAGASEGAASGLGEGNLLKSTGDGTPVAAAAEETMAAELGEGKLLKITEDDDGPPPVPPGTVGFSSYGDNDVLSGRGGGTNVHPGNRNFRDLINLHRRAYLKARKNDKPAISRAIVRAIRESGGRFLRKEKDQWVEMGDQLAWGKASQALRQRAPEMRKLLFDLERKEALQRQQHALLGLQVQPDANQVLYR